ncbi:hypothetical protein ACO0LO_04215 [Undibacterium sp. TJN25]|uniref:hypothetical protein n=1 Tax=Undibacterium sp. TJN25 TaxID=3413056 RepID=UPI003BF27933
MSNPSNPDDMLPVGMMGNVDAGSPAAQALETIAIRKHGTPGWEPFHYEKVSAAEYEVTGGVALVLTGGLRKWPEPHTSVLVTLEDIAAELRVRQHPAVQAAMPEAVQPTTEAAPSPADTAAPSVQGVSNPLASRYLTVVLQLPEDKEGRLRLIHAFSPDNEFFGATVTAASMEDEIAVTRALARHCTPEEVTRARQEAR